MKDTFQENILLNKIVKHEANLVVIVFKTEIYFSEVSQKND